MYRRSHRQNAATGYTFCARATAVQRAPHGRGDGAGRLISPHRATDVNYGHYRRNCVVVHHRNQASTENGRASN